MRQRFTYSGFVALTIASVGIVLLIGGAAHSLGVYYAPENRAVTDFSPVAASTGPYTVLGREFLIPLTAGPASAVAAHPLVWLGVATAILGFVCTLVLASRRRRALASANPRSSVDA